MRIYGKFDPTAPTRKTLRLSEAAAYLGVSESTIQRLVKAGRLKPAKLGAAQNSVLLFSVAELDQITKTKGN